MDSTIKPLPIALLINSAVVLLLNMIIPYNQNDLIQY